MKFTRYAPVVLSVLIALALVVQILLSIGFQLRPEKSFPLERKKVLLIGDSITEQSFSVEKGGWGAGLADWYHRTADVFNRGYSGYNSLWVRTILHEILPTSNFRILRSYSADFILAVILLGSNDSVLPGGAQHVPVADYRENVGGIVKHLRRHNPNIHIVLITPPPVNHELWPTRSIEQVAEYAEAMRSSARDLNCGLVDLWSGPNQVDLSDLIDGLHLGITGNQKLLTTLKATIRDKFQDIVPENNSHGFPNMQRQFPHSSAFRGASPQQAVDLIRSWNKLQAH